jgi:uncharacterized protein
MGTKHGWPWRQQGPQAANWSIARIVPLQPPQAFPRSPFFGGPVFGGPVFGVIAALVLAVGVLLCPATSWADSVASFPSAPPSERVLDGADVLSRAALGDLSNELQAFGPEHVDAHLITVTRLDYGLSLPDLAQQVVDRWLASGAEDNQLLFAVDAKTAAAAIAVSPGLQGELNTDLLCSTARATMAPLLRDGARYRQAGLDGMGRLLTVLQGGEDPGEPVVAEVVTPVSNIPTKEETSESNAFTWVVVLLVVGTLVPMLTWWIFSR